MHINWFVNIIGVHLHFHASSWNDLPKFHVCKSLLRVFIFFPSLTLGWSGLLNVYVRLFVLSKEGRLGEFALHYVDREERGNYSWRGKKYKVLMAWSRDNLYFQGTVSQVSLFRPEISNECTEVICIKVSRVETFNTAVVKVLELYSAVKRELVEAFWERRFLRKRHTQ